MQPQYVLVLIPFFYPTGNIRIKQTHLIKLYTDMQHRNL